METVVQKYGGSSLATSRDLRRVAERVAARHHRDGPMAVVVSARGDTTDELLRLAWEVGGGTRGREVDQLLATGECASAATMAMALRRLDVPAVSLTGAQAGIRTTSHAGAATITDIDTGRVRGHLDSGTTVVVAGFQGADSDGEVRTLGRGGSDTTAVALAAALDADRCEIYTDVSGVFTGDPRIAPQARVLAELDTTTMAEMAFTGAKVLHPRAVELADTHGVTVWVGDSRTSDSGSSITARPSGDLEASGAVRAITHDSGIARVLIHARRPHGDPARDVLDLLARHRVPVDLVARSGPDEEEFRIGFTIPENDHAALSARLEEAVAGFGGSLRVNGDVAKVSLVGMGMLSRPETTARVLTALSASGIETLWVFTSQLRVSVVVPLERMAAAVELLHDEFGLHAERADGVSAVPAP